MLALFHLEILVCNNGGALGGGAHHTVLPKVDDPKNRICDAPGSWYCVGQYPPALKGLIAKRKNFAQLEDFNKKGQEKTEYMKWVEARGGKLSANEDL